MPRPAAFKTLLGRPLRPDDFPIVIGRRTWANLLNWALLVPFVLVTLYAAWVLAGAFLSGSLSWIVRLLLFGGMILGGLACRVGLYNLQARLILDRDGIVYRSLATTQVFAWSEVTRFDCMLIPTQNALYPFGNIGYQAVIHVDGSSQPVRRWQNLMIAGHYMPPHMALDGKDLAKLLTKVKHWAETQVEEQS